MNYHEIIISMSAEYFGSTSEQIRIKHGIRGAKKKEIALARQVAMVCLKEFTNLSLKSIGYLIGERDHSTVSYAIVAIQDREDTERLFARKFTYLKERIMEECSMPIIDFKVDHIDKEFEHLL